MLILHHNSFISKVTHGVEGVDVLIVKLCPKFVTLVRDDASGGNSNKEVLCFEEQEVDTF